MTRKRILYSAYRYPPSKAVELFTTDSLEELAATLSKWAKLKARGDVVVSSQEVPASK